MDGEYFSMKNKKMENFNENNVLNLLKRKI